MDGNEFCSKLRMTLKNRGYVFDGSEISKNSSAATMFGSATKAIGTALGVDTPGFRYDIDNNVASSAINSLNQICVYSGISVKIDLVMLSAVFLCKIEEIDADMTYKILMEIGSSCRTLGLGQETSRNNSGGVHIRPIFITAKSNKNSRDLLLSKMTVLRLDYGVEIKPCIIDLSEGRLFWNKKSGILGVLEDIGSRFEVVKQSDVDGILGMS